MSGKTAANPALVVTHADTAPGPGLPARIATTSQLAEHLGVTKQAAAQLVEELVAKGYVERRPHPDDGRARLIVLTGKGRNCTRAAEAAIADTAGRWTSQLGERRLAALAEGLLRIAPRGPLHPLW